jgi:CRISPR/Cas system CSM-associated protein Csm2 small subunit
MVFERTHRQFPSGRGQASPQKRSPPQQEGGLPPRYLAAGYFDGRGNPLSEVIIDWPKQIAQQLERGGLAAAQLRNFFSEARHIEGQLAAGQGFAAVRPRILKLDAYAANAVKKGNAPKLFYDFIQHNLKWAATDEKSFLKGFVPHFESVVAYFPKK